MIELLTRNILALPEATHLTPIPVNEDISSLSAILLDDVYYKFVLQHRIPVQGATIIPAQCLIPLKAKAWLDLTTRRNAGDKRVKSNDIRKHRNDVFRLWIAMPPADRVSLPRTIRDDLATFLSSMPSDEETWRSIEKAVLDTTGVALPSRSESSTLIRRIFDIEFETKVIIVYDRIAPSSGARSFRSFSWFLFWRITRLFNPTLDTHQRHYIL